MEHKNDLPERVYIGDIHESPTNHIYTEGGKGLTPYVRFDIHWKSVADTWNTYTKLFTDYMELLDSHQALLAKISNEKTDSK